MAVWNSNHQVDPAIGHGTGYWPRLPSGLDTYSDVKVDSGRILDYTVNMYPSLGLSEAISRAEDELPPNATVVSSAPSPPASPSCRIVVFAEPILGARLSMDVAARFYSPSSAFTPTSVESVALSPLPIGSHHLPSC